MPERTRQGRFELEVLPHLRAAYDLARWIVGSSAEAQDVVQDGCTRAFAALDGRRGDSPRAWFLAIVRNSALRHLELRRRASNVVPFDEALHSDTRAGADPQGNPERAAQNLALGRQLRAALGELPVPFREAVVLRELHGLSYREIADVQGVPVGTVMSRLARARSLLRASLLRQNGTGRRDEL